MKSFFVAAMIALITLSGCNGINEPGTRSEEAQDIGQGSIVFLLEVTDDTQNVTSWNVHTEETTVGAALLEVGLIEGDIGPYGLMVMMVNGLSADFDADQSWWAFYAGGKLSEVGVDSTDIDPQKTYAFVYTKS